MPAAHHSDAPGSRAGREETIPALAQRHRNKLAPRLHVSHRIAHHLLNSRERRLRRFCYTAQRGKFQAKSYMFAVFLYPCDAVRVAMAHYLILLDLHTLILGLAPAVQRVCQAGVAPRLQLTIRTCFWVPRARQGVTLGRRLGLPFEGAKGEGDVVHGGHQRSQNHYAVVTKFGFRILSKPAPVKGLRPIWV